MWRGYGKEIGVEVNRWAWRVIGGVEMSRRGGGDVLSGGRKLFAMRKIVAIIQKASGYLR